MALVPGRVYGGFITNGGFETGDLTGWTVVTQAGSGGDMFVLKGDETLPRSGTPTVGPSSGTYHAVSDQDTPAAVALTQAFTVSGLSAGDRVILSFDLFVNHQLDSGAAVDASGLDYTSGGTDQPNQHARVDLLRDGAGALSTAGSDVLRNFYLGVDDFASNPNPYTHYSFDITDLVGAGGTFTIRFAEVNNQSPLNMGVDNVDVAASPASVVPAPTSLVLAVLGSVCLGLYCYRRRLLCNELRPVMT